MKKVTMATITKAIMTAAMVLALVTQATAQTQHVRLLRNVAQDPGPGAGEGVGSGIGAGQTSDPLPKDELFAGTEVFSKNASAVTEINMGPDSLEMVGQRAHNVILNVVRKYTYDKPGLYNIADVDAIRNRLNTGDWRCSVHTRNLKTGESTDVCNKHRTDDLEESAIITVEPKELTFIHTIHKRGSGRPMGDLSGGMPLVMLQNLPALAQVDPGMLSLKIGKDGLDPRTMFLLQTGPDSALAPLPQLDSPEMQKQMHELEEKLKALDTPEMREKLEQQLKDAPGHRGFILKLDPSAPIDPSVPIAPTSPAVPSAPPSSSGPAAK